MVNVSNLPVGLAEELAFSEDEIQELKIAREKPIVFDEDCPETTPERAMKFRRVNPPRENSAREHKFWVHSFYHAVKNSK